MVRYVLRWDVAYGHFGEVVQNVEAMNAIRRDRGWSEWVPWAPLSGKANQIVLICDGPDVATILAETDAGYADAEFMEAWKKAVEHSVEGTRWTEFLAPAPALVSVAGG